MRVAVTGASGLLGRELVGVLVHAGHTVIAAVHRASTMTLAAAERCALDLLDQGSIARFVAAVRADWIIHTAAIADVDRCEREPGFAQRLNADATIALADCVKGTPTRIAYVSTDYVFDGTAGPYNEAAPTKPINVYGASKLRGEEAVLAEGRHLVIRSASFLGIGPAGHPSFAERMVEQIRQSPPIFAPINRYSNVTPVDYLAKAIVALLEPPSNGVYHVVTREVISRHDLARRLAGLLGMRKDVVTDIRHDPIPGEAPRPLRGGLISTRATLEPPSLDEALAKFVANLQSGLSEESPGK
jgi:dTDP-4-dehydrorhamnose reductase